MEMIVPKSTPTEASCLNHRKFYGIYTQTLQQSRGRKIISFPIELERLF